uniref:Uncharacterized protein n=1 Tax=Tetranychus urticae TaxID=32264 RepID=T1KXG0_TETUR
MMSDVLKQDFLLLLILLIVYCIILLILFLIKVKRARAMRGVYSPSAYEQYQVTIPYIIRPPPIERLI